MKDKYIITRYSNYYIGHVRYAEKETSSYIEADSFEDAVEIIKEELNLDKFFNENSETIVDTDFEEYDKYPENSLLGKYRYVLDINAKSYNVSECINCIKNLPITKASDKEKEAIEITKKFLYKIIKERDKYLKEE